MKTLATWVLFGLLAIVASTGTLATTAVAGSINRIQTDTRPDYTVGYNFYQPNADDPFYYLAESQPVSPFPTAPRGWTVEMLITALTDGAKKVWAYPDKAGLPDYDFYADKSLPFLGKITGGIFSDLRGRRNARRENEEKRAFGMDEDGAILVYKEANKLGYNACAVWLKTEAGKQVRVLLLGFIQVYTADKNGWVRISLPFGVEECPYTKAEDIQRWIRRDNIPGRFTQPGPLDGSDETNLSAVADAATRPVTSAYDSSKDPNIQKLADAVNLLSAQVVTIAGQVNTNTTDIAQLKADVASLKQWATTANQGAQQTQPATPRASATPPCQPQPTNQNYKIAFVCKGRPVACVFVKVCEDGRWGEFRVNGGVCEFKNETPGHRTMYWRLDQTAAWQQYSYEVAPGMVDYQAVSAGM